MAGISFFRARSPVTPNSTRTHGPATRGMRRSRGSRNGLTIISLAPLAVRRARGALASAARVRAGGARNGGAGGQDSPSCSVRGGAGRVEQLAQARCPVPQVKADGRAAALTQRAEVSQGLGELQPAQGEVPPRNLHIVLDGAGDLQ